MIKIFFILIFSIVQYTVYAGVVPSATPDSTTSPKTMYSTCSDSTQKKQKKKIFPFQKKEKKISKAKKERKPHSVLHNIYFYWMVWAEIWIRFTVYFISPFITYYQFYTGKYMAFSSGLLIYILFINPISIILLFFSLLFLFAITIVLIIWYLEDKKPNPKLWASLIFMLILKLLMLIINIGLKIGQYMYANAIFMGIILIYLLITHLWLFPRWKRKGLI